MTTISFEATFGAGPNIEREVQRRLHIPKIPELHLPEVSDDELSDIVPRYNDLIPLGDTGLHITPNDPVDPWDCGAWPGSPYCDGGPVVDPLESGYPGAYADLGISPDGCEVCVTVTPSILWMEGPPYTVCYRFPGPRCRPGGEPEVDNSDIEDGIPQDVPKPPWPPPATAVFCGLGMIGGSEAATVIPSELITYPALGAVQGTPKLGPIPPPAPTNNLGFSGLLPSQFLLTAGNFSSAAEQLPYAIGSAPNTFGTTIP
jgi:hypothetical protein